MTAISLGNLFDSAMQAFALGTGTTRRPESVVPAETEAESSGNPMEDYVVELSEAARKLAESENPFEKALNGSGLSGASKDDEEDEENSTISQLKERIRQVQEEISEIQDDPELTDEERQQKLLLKQSELAELQTQLAKALEANLDGLQVGGKSLITNAGGLS